MKSFAVIFKSLALSLLLATSAYAADKVNINTADAAAIDAVLVNIGPAKAQAIVDYRKANGVFKSAEELAMVKGIGLKTVEKNRDRIELGRTAPVQKPAAGNAATATKAKPVARR
ncbi:MAG: helix-hairpin-helix domain-containing protein [Pseudoxanthomonas sp.]